MNSKMTEDEIAAQVQATLALAEQVEQVEVPLGFKDGVMKGIEATASPVLRPLWLKATLAAAAAILILAANTLTISHFVADRHVVAVASTDPLDQIRMDYSLTDTDI